MPAFLRPRHVLGALVLTAAVASAAPPKPASRPLTAASLPTGIAKVILRSELGPDQVVAWGGGESMTFSVKLAGVEGGRGAISVGLPRTRAGRRSLKLRSLGETSEFISNFRRIREEDLVHLDLAGLLPLDWSADRTLNNRRRQLTTTFGAGPSIKQVMRQDGKTQEETRRISGGPVLEALSALFALRTARLTPGLRLRRLVLGGLSLYRVEIVVRGPEHIVVRDHPRDTIRLDGVARQIYDDGSDVPKEPPRKFSLWLGQDPARIPYRIRGETKLGSAEAVLTSYHPPRAPLKVRLHRAATDPQAR